MFLGHFAMALVLMLCLAQILFWVPLAGSGMRMVPAGYSYPAVDCQLLNDVR